MEFQSAFVLQIVARWGCKMELKKVEFADRCVGTFHENWRPQFVVELFN